MDSKQNKEPYIKRPLYSKSKVKNDDGSIEEAIAFGKRDLVVVPAFKGTIPKTGATKDTIVYGKFNNCANRPFENLKDLLN